MSVSFTHMRLLSSRDLLRYVKTLLKYKEKTNCVWAQLAMYKMIISDLEYSIYSTKNQPFVGWLAGI